ASKLLFSSFSLCVLLAALYYGRNSRISLPFELTESLQRCPTSSLSSSFALSLLRQAFPSSESFVLSPFSLGTALAIIHDGAGGNSQSELTKLFLEGCTASDVTSHYSSLARSLAKSGNANVSFTSANRLYVADSIFLKEDFIDHISNNYNVEADKINVNEKDESAKKINNFVEKETDGKMTNIINTQQITDDLAAILVNAVYFEGAWEYQFCESSTDSGIFHGVRGDIRLPFMALVEEELLVNMENDFGTALVLPYKGNEFKFFILMTKETSEFEKMRNDLTGEKINRILYYARPTFARIYVPRIQIKSNLDGVEVLKRLGVHTVFSDEADLSKLTDNSRVVMSKIFHGATIETNEMETKAAANFFSKLTSDPLT
ncbi:hypothetical protein PFISCL1PPCAC_5188, partial [Pristionchus fissidentatus]